MHYTFSEIVDIPAIQELMEGLWKSSGIPVGIVDIEGTVLVATGWQDICTQFHRSSSESEALCRESDAYLQEHLAANRILPESGYYEYHCKNGMIDIAVPIVIEGQHLATLFLGQFFYEPPEENFFLQQAQRYGFDKERYLVALKKVPIFDRQKVKDILDYHTRFVNLMTQMGVQKLRSIEDRKALSESEERFRTIFESAAAPMGIISTAGHMLQVNPAACHLIGYSETELLGFNIEDFVHPEDREDPRTLYQDLLSGKSEAISYKKRYQRKDGSTVWGHATIAPVRDAEGAPLYLVILMQDVTDSKEKELELIYREAFETLVTGISTRFVELPTFATDRGIDLALEDLGKFVGVDRSYVFLFSADGEHMDNTHEWCAKKIVSKKEKLQSIARGNLSWALERTLSRQVLHVPSVVELPLVAQAEKDHWQEQDIKSLITMPILAAGKVIGFLGFDGVGEEQQWGEKDIALLQTVGNLFGSAIQRQRVVAAQQESERRISTLLDNLPGMAYRCRNDRDWTMEFVSDGCRALTGYFPEDLVGNKAISYAEVIHPEDREHVWQQVQDGLVSKGPFELEYRIRTVYGSERWVWEQGRGIFDKDGKLLAMEGFISDITERRLAVETLRQSDLMKTEFVKTVAHELRTPLTAIQGFSELLINQAQITPEEQAESLRYIYERSFRLSELVDEMLNIARIESGAAISLKMTPCSVAEIYRLFEPFLKVQLGLHPLEVNLENESSTLYLDKGKIVQVFENLLSNAIKFSDSESSIQIMGCTVGDDYQVSVVDKGIGMTPDQAEKVFEKFYRVDASDTAVDGVGLGMNIVKHIVEAHGGRIWVESNLSRGTIVRFTLPLYFETGEN